MLGEPPPSNADLVARLEALKHQTEEVLERSRRAAAPSPMIALRGFLLLGLPVVVAVVIYLATSRVLFAILALAGALVATIAIALKLTPMPAHLKPGTRSWEASMTLLALSDTIASRRSEAERIADPAKRARLDREITFLVKQRQELEHVAAANDFSQGKGYVGFEPYNGD